MVGRRVLVPEVEVRSLAPQPHAKAVSPFRRPRRAPKRSPSRPARQGRARVVPLSGRPNRLSEDLGPFQRGAAAAQADQGRRRMSRRSSDCRFRAKRQCFAWLSCDVLFVLALPPGPEPGAALARARSLPPVERAEFAIALRPLPAHGSYFGDDLQREVEIDPVHGKGRGL
jgi:hypothetical protein